MVNGLIIRTIVHEPGFDAAAEDLFGSASGADTALNGVLWELAREPNLTRYHFVPGTKLRAYRTSALLAIPSVVVYFAEMNSEVHLFGIST